MFEQDAFDDFVSVRGEVQLVTDLGVLLTVQSRRLFVGALCMQPPDRILEVGKAATLRVLRSFAQQVGLVA
jgi:hypothetical protein